MTVDMHGLECKEFHEILLWRLKDGERRFWRWNLCAIMLKFVFSKLLDCKAVQDQLLGNHWNTFLDGDAVTKRRNPVSTSFSPCLGALD